MVGHQTAPSSDVMPSIVTAPTNYRGRDACYVRFRKMFRIFWNLTFGCKLHCISHIVELLQSDNFKLVSNFLDQILCVSPVALLFTFQATYGGICVCGPNVVTWLLVVRKFYNDMGTFQQI